MDKQIDCPTCERMGRVTVILPNGNLTTSRCDNCNGEGFIMEHHSIGCEICAHSNAGAIIVGHCTCCNAPLTQIDPENVCMDCVDLGCTIGEDN